MENAILFILLAGALGILCGLLLSQLAWSSRIASIRKAELEKLEEEKVKLAGKLNSQLNEMRDGLIQTVRAYDKAVRNINEDFLSQNSNNLLDIPQARQLHLELDQEEVLEKTTLAIEGEQPSKRVSESLDSLGDVAEVKDDISFTRTEVENEDGSDLSSTEVSTSNLDSTEQKNGTSDNTEALIHSSESDQEKLLINE